MPYVSRNAEGQIQSLHRQPEPQAAEFLDDRHAEVLAFVGLGIGAADAPPIAQFGQLDAEFVRVIEDVIDTLIIKNIINITELPVEAQAKLFARRSFRERVSKSSLRLFEPSQFGDVI